MMADGWISARKRQPSDYLPYLCALRMNDGSGGRWQRVLHYDIMNKVWCENDPSTCMAGAAKEITGWGSVVYWRPLEWPRDMERF